MFVLALARSASATQTVVLVMAGGSQQELAPVEQQLRSELLAGGFGVTSIQVPELSDAASFEQTVSGLVSQAAIAVIRSESSVSGFVWATSRDHERMLVRPIEPVALSDEAPGVFAIRASELLHAILLELGWPKRPPPETTGAPAPTPTESPAPEPPLPAPPAPSPPPKRTTAPAQKPALPPQPGPEAPRLSTWTAHVGVGVVGGPGGVPVAAAARLGLSRRLTPNLALEAMLMGPVVGSVEDSAGSARIDQELGALRLGWETRLTPWLEGALVGGVGAHRLGVAGRAISPHAGRRDAVWSALLLLGAEARIPLGQRFALCGEADAGFTSPRGQVTFLDEPVAQVALPLVLGVLAGEFTW